MEEPNAKTLGSWTCPDRNRFLMPAILAGLPLKDLLYQSTLYCSSGFTFHLFISAKLAYDYTIFATSEQG